MLILSTIAEIRKFVKEKRLQGKRVGYVATMGYLHEGHLSLVKAARQENDTVIMSIFVNPLQFGPQEDFAAYPRDLARDAGLAEGAGADVIFTPEVSEMYPYYPQLTTVEVREMTLGLCGASRPGHFTGVTTVVAKLFNIIQPDTAYFGQKDYQQALVIKRMVEDLNISVEIKTVPIKREEDGLAMSSRNTYLSRDERKQALCLSQSLQLAAAMFEKGERSPARLIEAMKERIRREPAASIDYIEIRDAASLKPVSEIKGRAVIALAVKIGRTRLIDNIIVEG